MDAQIASEAVIRKPYVSDRCIIDPMAYVIMQDEAASNHLSNDNDHNNHDNATLIPSYGALRYRPDAERTLAEYRDIHRSLVILLEPVEEFAVDDGTRKVVESMEEWTQCLHAFEHALENAGIRRYKRLGPEIKDLGERVRKVKEWVQQTMVVVYK